MIWEFGETLSTVRVLLFAAASIFFLALITYELHHAGEAQFDRRVFLHRVLSTYGLTLRDLCPDTRSASTVSIFSSTRGSRIKRTILVAFPASFAATVVDSFR